MGELPAAEIDVRDMLCAQALALASSAMNKLAPGNILQIVFNTSDVKNDLLIWAREKGHAVAQHTGTTLCLTR